MPVTFLTPADLFDFWPGVIVLILVAALPCALLFVLFYFIRNRRQAATGSRDAGQDKHE